MKFFKRTFKAEKGKHVNKKKETGNKVKPITNKKLKKMSRSLKNSKSPFVVLEAKNAKISSNSSLDKYSSSDAHIHID
jgi:hypothetical protein